MPNGNYALNFMAAEQFIEINGKVRNVRLKTAYNYKTKKKDTLAVFELPKMKGKEMRYTLLGQESILHNDYVNVNEEEETEFKIYPSPAQDYIQVVAEAQFRGLTYSIFDIQGKLVHTGNMQNQGSTRIDVSQFSTGMYAIQISDSLKGIVAKKMFVKE